MQEQKYNFKSGDTIKVHFLIKEGDKQRVQIFQGLCIKVRNKGQGSSFTVRKISSGIGVERIFPVHSPLIQKIETVSKGKVRRSKLYYIRELFGKKARIKSEEQQQ